MVESLTKLKEEMMAREKAFESFQKKMFGKIRNIDTPPTIATAYANESNHMLSEYNEAKNAYKAGVKRTAGYMHQHYPIPNRPEIPELEKLVDSQTKVDKNNINKLKVQYLDEAELRVDRALGRGRKEGGPGRPRRGERTKDGRDGERKGSGPKKPPKGPRGAEMEGEEQIFASADVSPEDVAAPGQTPATKDKSKQPNVDRA